MVPHKMCAKTHSVSQQAERYQNMQDWARIQPEVSKNFQVTFPTPGQAQPFPKVLTIDSAGTPLGP